VLVVCVASLARIVQKCQRGTKSDRAAAATNDLEATSTTTGSLTRLVHATAHLYRVGEIKLFNLIVMSQVVSQFVYISDGTGSTSAVPEPAATFVRLLSVANLDLAGLVPVGCVFRSTTAYDLFLFKIVSPLAVVALLWIYPSWRFMTYGYHHDLWQSAARYSILFIELVLPMVSTAVAEIYLCNYYDGSYHLRIELTLPCDASAQRRTWVAIASVALVVYPIGASVKVTTPLSA
jgi:hypothetical protein